MTSQLHHLPDDVWKMILSLMEADDLCRLWSSGSRLVQRRLGMNLEDFKTTFNAIGFLPMNQYASFGALFKNIKSMRIESAPEISLVLPWKPVSWDLMPKTLRTLELAFSDCAALLLDSTLDLTCCLPTLELLSLTSSTGTWKDDWNLKIEVGLPKTLTSLSIKISSGHYPLSMFSTLPRQFRVIRIKGARASIRDLEAKILEAPQFLPTGPHSSSTAVASENKSSAQSVDTQPTQALAMQLVTFPPEMEILEIRLQTHPIHRDFFPPHYLHPSCLPRTLKVLKIVNYDASIFQDGRWRWLPPNLSTIDFGKSFHHGSFPWGYLLQRIPPSVTSIRLPCNGDLGFPVDPNDGPTVDFESFPAEIYENFPVAKDIDRLGIKHLDSDDINYMKAFLGRLKEVRFQQVPQETFYFKNVEKMNLFSRRPPSSYPPSLTHLHTAVLPTSIIDTTGEIENTPLPTTIKTLSILAYSHFAYNANTIPVWPLGLQTLLCAMQTMDEDAIKSLPRTLRKLTTSFENFHCISHLPESVTELSIMVRHPTEDDEERHQVVHGQEGGKRKFQMEEALERFGLYSFTFPASLTSLTLSMDFCDGFYKRLPELLGGQLKTLIGANSTIHSSEVLWQLLALPPPSLSSPSPCADFLSPLSSSLAPSCASSRKLGNSLTFLSTRVSFPLSALDFLALQSNTTLRTLAISSLLSNPMGSSPSSATRPEEIFPLLPRSLTSVSLPSFSSPIRNFTPALNSLLPPGLSVLEIGERNRIRFSSSSHPDNDDESWTPNNSLPPSP